MSRAEIAFEDLLLMRRRTRVGSPPPRHEHRPPRHEHRPLLRERWPLRRAVVVLLFAGSAGAAIYPTAATWISDRLHANELSGYVESVAGMLPVERSALLDAARAYNGLLPSGPVIDPYSLGADGIPEALAPGAERYLETLAIGPDAMMGRIRIDEIGVSLPIYHGTGERSLSQGVGHLYGTALPIGGSGTHSVLTSHSGLLNATLFTRLGELAIGDEFTIIVLDETLVYEVDRIETVTPERTEGLRATPGEDYVTLVTCTPTGVNTHRLLVRGHRVPAPLEDTGERLAIAGATGDAGFPWWALGYLAALVAAILLSRLMVRRGQSAPEPSPGPRRRGLT